MFMTVAVMGIFLTGQPTTSGGTAAISIRLVQVPWATRPAMNRPGVGARTASTDPITNTVAYRTSMRRPRRCTANCTAITVPNA
jgi:hypothetical protein